MAEGARQAGRDPPGSSEDDRDQGLVRPRPRVRARRLRLVGAARADAGAEERRRGPGRAGAARRREPPGSRSAASSSRTTPTRWSSGSATTSRSASTTSSSTRPGDDQLRFLDQFCRGRRAEAQRAFLNAASASGAVDGEDDAAERLRGSWARAAATMSCAHSSSGKPPTPVPNAGSASDSAPSSSATSRVRRVAPCDRLRARLQVLAHHGGVDHPAGAQPSRRRSRPRLRARSAPSPPPRARSPRRRPA